MSSLAFDWYLDSGAIAHRTNQPSLLDSYTPYPGPDRVVLGDGTSLSISHIGSRKISNDVSLLDVLVVPHITKNFLSITKLTVEFPVDVLFSNSSFTVQKRITKSIVAQGQCRDRLYLLDRGIPTFVADLRLCG